MKNIINIIKLAKPLYGLTGIIAFLIVVAALIDLVTPILSKFIVDDIVQNLQHKGGSINNLTVLIALTFILGLFSLVLTTLSDRLGDHFAGRLRKFLTEKFYHKV